VEVATPFLLPQFQRPHLLLNIKLLQFNCQLNKLSIAHNQLVTMVAVVVTQLEFLTTWLITLNKLRLITPILTYHIPMVKTVLAQQTFQKVLLRQQQPNLTKLLASKTMTS
jgi:hypothetical protein